MGIAQNLAIVGAGTTLFLLSVAVVALIAGYYDATFPFENEFAIVVDSGSSSSKFFLYSWPEGLSVSKGEEVKITQVDLCTQSPGIDKVTTRDAITLYFEPCINQIRKKIPAGKRNRTFITLGATAGMRLLNSSNSQLASSIVGYVQDYFAANEFYYTNPKQVRIISGIEEGLYGWIATNYFIESFEDRTKTYGILDLGGASTQIGYLPDNSDQIAKNTSVQKYFNSIRIYGLDYNVYSSSYLCYGVDQVLLLYQAYLIMLGNYASNVNGACYNLGVVQNVSTASLVASNCANGAAFKLPNGGIDLTLLQQRPFYLINGQSDLTACQNQMNALFSTTVCNYGSCSFNDVFLANKTDNYFYGFSNYYFAINNTETLSRKSLKKNFDEYKNQSDYLCSLNYTALTTINNGAITDRFLRTVCFNNHIVLSLLTNFKITDFKNVEITLDIKGNAVGWSLGYLFQQINRDDFLPTEEPRKKLPYEFFLPSIIVSGVLTGLLLISLIGFLIYLIKS